MGPLAAPEILAKRLLGAIDVAAGHQALARCARVGSPGCASTAGRSSSPGRPSFPRRAHISRIRARRRVGLGVKRVRAAFSGGGSIHSPRHVNGLMPPGGGDFDAGHQRSPSRPALCAASGRPATRIVIGERQDLDPGRGRARRPIRPVPRCRRSMFEWVCRSILGAVLELAVHDGLPASRRPPGAGPTSTMKPCARSKPSLV